MTPELIAAALTGLQLFDGWSTYKILGYPTGGERNKLMRRIIAFLARYMSERKAEYTALLLTKGGAAGLAWVLALVPIAHQASEEIRLGLLVALAVLYGWIAVNNWRIYRRLRGLR